MSEIQRAADEIVALAIVDVVRNARAAERKAVVDWLQRECLLCDCFARSEGECACGAWYDNKQMSVQVLLEAIERGDHVA